MIDAAELRKLCLSFPGIGRDLPLLCPNPR